MGNPVRKSVELLLFIMIMLAPLVAALNKSDVDAWIKTKVTGNPTAHNTITLSQLIATQYLQRLAGPFQARTAAPGSMWDLLLAQQRWRRGLDATRLVSLGT